MSVYVLGDIHFSANRPWRLPMGDLFLDWLEKVEVEPNSSFIGLGDNSDDAVNPGGVVSQLERLTIILQKKFNVKSY